MKTITRFLSGTVLGVGLSLASMTQAAQEMNLAFTPPLNSHYGDAGKAFADKMEQLSGGAFKINLKPAGALGGERDVVEGLQIGSVELTITSTGPVGSFVPEVFTLDFPFLFDSYASAHQVLDGEIGQELLAKFEPQGLIGLAWAENGFRHVTNNVHPVEKPEDLAGLKLRTMENKVHIAAFQAAGAAPTPMSWTEVITALQQGTVDGQENPVTILTANNFWEFQKYLTLTGHVYSPAAVLMSKIVWDDLDEQQRGWFVEAARAAAQASRDTVARNEKAGVELLQQNGMEVVTNIDKAAFQAAVQPAYDKYAEEYGASLIQRIRDAQ
ncbi:C4-dicarboxylate ABC transporter substrate-binding protein [Marinobacterium aestuarii]|uniref:C4-dicarboxylate ABC transporter substrate-binding protein n=1 Tax=Marinobacterium aestuarii TaxID=1821621 RepID=A0A1A9F094_9GAMM|nr:TRAP transporter substrate-binding protein [Marinobacterium aestuarii]ANG63199.1 C4-dicarboxylate ABC transporter substrate-binding protein [Marinobacterium aestuarii]